MATIGARQDIFGPVAVEIDPFDRLIVPMTPVCLVDFSLDPEEVDIVIVVAAQDSPTAKVVL